MQILIELDDETARRLEKVAPAKSRKRSAFVRTAIQRHLFEVEEEKTRAAYLATPDTEPTPFEASSFEPLPFGGFEPPPEARKAARTRSKKKRRSK